MPVIMTLMTRADIEAYARDREAGHWDKGLEAAIFADPLARQIFDQTRSALRNRTLCARKLRLN